VPYLAGVRRVGGHRVPSRIGRTLGAAAALLLATVVAAVVALVVVSRHHPADSATRDVATATAQRDERPVASNVADLPAAVREAARWMGRELPRGATVSAPAGATALLRRSGFVVSASSSYVLTASASPVTGALPVAEFRAGGDAAAVLQRVASAPHSLAARRAADAASRRSAERQLLGNHRLHASAAARAVLSGGGLDLRAATVLALLASSGPVSVVAVRGDPPEQAAGLPARVVDLRVASRVADAVRQQLPAGYRPASVAALPTN